MSYNSLARKLQMHYGKQPDVTIDINNNSFNNKSRQNSIHSNKPTHITNSQRRRKNYAVVNLYKDEIKMPTEKEVLPTDPDLNSTRNFIYSKNEIFNTYNCTTAGNVLDKPNEIFNDKNEKSKIDITLGLFDKKDQEKINTVSGNKQLCMASSKILDTEKSREEKNFSREHILKAEDTKFKSLIHKCGF